MHLRKPKLSKEDFFLLLILILAAFLRIWWMWEWPLIFDEALPANYAFDIIKGVEVFYINLVYYQGPMISYVLMPSLLLFGKNIFFLRISIVLISLASIFLLFIFTKKYYNKNVALFASLILAITPNDILNSSIAFEVPLISFFIILSLYLFYKFSETRKNTYLFLFSFVSGLAIMTRLTFLFFLISFFLTLKFNPFIKFKEFRKTFSSKIFVFLVILFLFGFSPMIYFNILHNFPGIQLILKTFPFTIENVNLFDVKGNLLNGYSNFVEFLDRNSRFGDVVSFESDKGLYNFSAIFLLSLILFVGIPIKKYFEKKRFVDSLKNFYLFINFLIILTLTFTLTISSFRNVDFLSLFPLYSIIIAWSIVYVADFLRNKKIILFVLLTFLFSFYIFIFFNNHAMLLSELPKNPCNKILPELLKYSKNSNSSRLIFDTLRYAEPFIFSSDLTTSNIKINTLNIKWFNNSTWVQRLLNVTTSYIFIKDECNTDWSDKYISFINFLNQYNKTLVLQQTVTDNNEILFKVFKIV